MSTYTDWSREALEATCRTLRQAILLQSYELDRLQRRVEALERQLDEQTRLPCSPQILHIHLAELDPERRALVMELVEQIRRVEESANVDHL